MNQSNNLKLWFSYFNISQEAVEKIEFLHEWIQAFLLLLPL